MFSGETTKTNVIALYIVFGFKGPVLKHKIYRTQDKHPGFQVRGGAHLKKLRRAEGGSNIFGVFRVKNHDFTPKNRIFSIAEGGAKIFEVFRVKNHDFTPKNHIVSNFRGARTRCTPDYTYDEVSFSYNIPPIT